MTDEVFSLFLKEFAGQTDRREVPLSCIDLYRSKLPELLLKYWAEHGWCGYGEGIFWLVNPQEYEEVVASWIQGTKFETLDTYHLIARSAFGDLYLWGEKTGASLNITGILSKYAEFYSASGEEQMDKQLQNFLLTRNIGDDNYGEFFEPAQKKLGTLRHDEMYGFVPAFMLGGRDTLEHLEKVKAVEHLILLSQITELQPYSFSDT